MRAPSGSRMELVLSFIHSFMCLTHERTARARAVRHATRHTRCTAVSFQTCVRRALLPSLLRFCMVESVVVFLSVYVASHGAHGRFSSVSGLVSDGGCRRMFFFAYDSWWYADSVSPLPRVKNVIMAFLSPEIRLFWQVTEYELGMLPAEVGASLFAGDYHRYLGFCSHLHHRACLRVELQGCALAAILRRPWTGCSLQPLPLLFGMSAFWPFGSRACGAIEEQGRARNLQGAGQPTPGGVARSSFLSTSGEPHGATS